MDTILRMTLLLCVLSLCQTQAPEEKGEEITHIYSLSLDPIVLRCTFDLPDAITGLINGKYAFKFYKAQEFANTDDEIQLLNSGALLNDGLDTAMKEHIQYRQNVEAGKAWTQITIINPEPEDSGKYRCVLLTDEQEGAESQATYKINIMDLQDFSVKIYADDTPMNIPRYPNVTDWPADKVIQLRQKPQGDIHRYAYLAAVAENVPAEVLFNISLEKAKNNGRNRQLTAEFTSVSLAKIEGGTFARRRFVVDHLFEDREFPVNALDDGATIKVVARIEDGNNNVVKTVEETATLNLAASPVFMNCSENAYAGIGTKNYKISCLVRSKPALTKTKWTVTPRGNGDAFEVINNTYGYHTGLRASDGENVYEVQLFINEVKEQQHILSVFRVEVTNPIGSSKLRILLRKWGENTTIPRPVPTVSEGTDPNTIPSTDGAVQFTSAFILLLLSALAAVLIQ